MNKKTEYFHNKKLLVVGGSSGIGLAVVERFLKLGSKVTIFDIDGTNFNQIEENLSSYKENILCIQGDVRKNSDILNAINESARKFGDINILVYSAGIFPNDLFLKMTEKQWDKVNDINSKGAFLTSQAFAKQLISKSKSGHIIHIASGSYSLGRVGSAHYCASKASLAMLTKVSAMELAPYKIKVNALAPGLVEHPLIDDTYRNQYVNKIPWGRIARPEDIAAAVEMICSASNTFITGQTIQVDGGMNAGYYDLPFSNKET